MTSRTLFWRPSDQVLSLTPRQRFGNGNRFSLIDVLGQGGFGQVWRARDTWLEQEIALKVSEDDVSAETLLLRRLPKDRYVSIYDYVRDDGRAAFGYTMEILDSPWITLERHREIELRPRFDEGEFVQPLKKILRITIDVLTSLNELHGKRYQRRGRWIHGDIKTAKRLRAFKVEQPRGLPAVEG